MADLNTLEEKLGEVAGLAAAAQDVTRKVEALLEDDSELLAELRTQREEAEETERRCVEVAGEREGKKTAILDKAAETKKEAKAFMDIYLDEESDELDGYEFLTMTEAGEVGHWRILAKVNEKADEESLTTLVEWALPIQERHEREVRDAALKLAADEDPYEA
jgi:Ni,Fe-hydrogenase III component G